MCVIFIQLVELIEVIQVRAPPGLARFALQSDWLKMAHLYAHGSCNHKLLKCRTVICPAGIVFLVNSLRTTAPIIGRILRLTYIELSSYSDSA